MNEVRRHVLAAVLVASAVLTGHATAQERVDLQPVFEELRELTRADLRLFNQCEPMRLNITVGESVRAIGLTEDRIRGLAERRLRVARLLSVDDGPSLLVWVYVVGQAFYAEVTYSKLLYDAVTGETGYIPTWRMHTVKTHGGDAGYILQTLSEELDSFVLTYLRVNEAACAP